MALTWRIVRLLGRVLWVLTVLVGGVLGLALAVLLGWITKADGVITR